MRVISYLLMFIAFYLDISHCNENEKDPNYWQSRGRLEIKEALRVTKNMGKAKNVILFIGDGMGPSTVTASRIYSHGEEGNLIFEKFPNVGILKTYAVDMTVPDSACTANALFSGVKTNFEVVGLDAHVKLGDCASAHDPSFELETIMDWAQKANMDTGFVTDARVTHATPSALYAHSADRRWECDGTIPDEGRDCMDIAKQLVLNSPGKNLKVIMGGGRQCLETNSISTDVDPIDLWSCYRKDGLNLTDTWLKDRKNAAYLKNKGELKKLNTEDTDYILGLFSNGHIKYTDERVDSDDGPPRLAAMTEAAIKILRKNPKGFVLMVEGGLIDLAHHRGYVRRALNEVKEFQDAISTALKLTNSMDTLIIVTADHAHSLVINGISPKRGDIFGVSRPSKANSLPYPVLTYMVGGPKNFPYKTNGTDVIRDDPSLIDTTKPDYQPLAGILNDEVYHSGVDVEVFAQGPMAHLFHNVHEQTYVAYVIAYAAKIGPYNDGKGRKKVYQKLDHFLKDRKRKILTKIVHSNCPWWASIMT